MDTQTSKAPPLSAERRSALARRIFASRHTLTAQECARLTADLETEIRKEITHDIIVLIRGEESAID